MTKQVAVLRGLCFTTRILKVNCPNPDPLLVGRTRTINIPTLPNTRPVGPPPPPPFTFSLTSTPRFFATSNSNSDSDPHSDYVSPFSSSSYGDPCLDLFFHIKSPDTHYFYGVRNKDVKHEELLEYLKQLLPVAWSHSPLTTLKLICSFGITPGRFCPDAFYTAALWLHHNHPKTLLCNLLSLAADDTFGNANVVPLIEIPYRLLEPQEDAAQRARRDPDYKLLHDRAMDLFAEALEADIQKMKQKKLEMKPSDFTNENDTDSDSDDEEDAATLDAEAYADLFVSQAADYCMNRNPSDVDEARAILLYENAAKRLCQPPSESESDQPREWERFRKEVLAPLTKYFYRQGNFLGRQRCEVKKYLEDIAGNNFSGMKSDALLPHQIVRYAQDGGLVGQAAEHQWKAMVEHMYQKGHKFDNCLAVCSTTDFLGGTHKDLGVGLGLLVSQLSQEPWKGKAVCFFDNSPQLVAIQGNDLKSKCEFLSSSKDSGHAGDLLKVIDLILDEAVNENLKPEQMIKKLFVFKSYLGLDIRHGNEEVKRRFKERGYGDDVVPHILHWRTAHSRTEDLFTSPTQHPGIARLSGFTDDLVKSFLDNGGEIGSPRHLMELTLSGKEYQRLNVVD